MKYKKKESGPIPGEILNAQIREVSLVDSPANGRKFLFKKRENMKDELKKKLQKMGFNAEQIELVGDKPSEKLEKALQAIAELDGENISEDISKGFMDSLKKFFLPKEPNSEIKSVIEPLIKKIEAIETKIVKSDTNSVSEQKPGDNDLIKRFESLEKSLAQLEKSESEPEEQPKQEDPLIKKLDDLEKRISSLIKMRTGGNSEPQANVSGLTPEELEKRKKNNLFKGSALDFSM